MQIADDLYSISIIKSQAKPQFGKPTARSGDSLPALAKLYQAEERKLLAIARQFDEDPTEDPGAPHLGLQTDIMDIASNIPATTFEGLFFKMVLWYWDAPDVTDLSYVCRSDRVLLSILKDLSQLSNRPIEKST